MNEIVVSSDRRFGRAILGLNKAEVYAYLNEVSSAYEELQLQIQVLKDQNNKLSDSNRDNALKLYNLQNDVTEAQKKTDRANVELEAAKKECAALRKELEAAEKRISKLTDELIKAGSGAADPLEEEKPKREEPVAEETKGFTPKPIFDVEEEVKKPEGPKDIFAELREIASNEAKQAKPEVTESQPADSGTDAFDDEEVYAGEVEIKVDESMLIGNDDDEEEGFTFL